FYPTYLAKMAFVRRYLSLLERGTRVLDAGCGEGLLVEQFRDRLSIEGVDACYASSLVQQASITSLPFATGRFDRVVCLDVLEHLGFREQPMALAELARVLDDNGEALVSVPNLAHLQSRLHFLLDGRLIRTASETKHPGDRPIGEYLHLVREAGFTVVARHGIFPTIPVLTHLIRRYPDRLVWLHDLLTRLLPVPNWCFLNIIRLRKRHPGRVSVD
ncbi:MAG: class I SAM-dependent methyltransferase, partial [Acidimicrobiia bacterium]